MHSDGISVECNERKSRSIDIKSGDDIHFPPYSSLFVFSFHKLSHDMASGDSVGSRKTSDCLVSSLTRGSEEMYTYECDACKLDGEIREGKFYCYSCEDYLCSECESFHKKVKVTRSHEIVAADEVPHKPYSNKSALRHAAGSNTDELCTCSQRKYVEFYCKEHADIFCSLCKEVHHSSCHTATIDEVSRDKDFQDIFDSTFDKLEMLVKKTLGLEIKSNDATTDFEKMEDNCRKTIRSVRSEVILLFDKLEQTALEDLKFKATEHLDVLKDANTMVQSTLCFLNTDKRKAEEVKNNSGKQQMFVTCTKINKTLPSYEVAVALCQDKLLSPSLTFVKHPILTDLHVNLDSLGVVNSLLTSTKVKNVTFMDSEVKTHKIVDVKDTSDSNKPWIRGIAFLANGDLLVSDHDNKRITLFSKEVKKRKTSIQCDAKPWDIVVIDVKQSLVTFSENREIHVLHVGVNDSLSFTQTMKIDEPIQGITLLNEMIYVVCFLGSGSTHAVLILDKSGTLQRTIEKEKFGDKYS